MRNGLIALLSVLLACPAITFAAADGDPELLKQTAVANETNLSRIHTWRGTAVLSDISFRGGEILYLDHKAEFYVDVDKGMKRWHWVIEHASKRKDQDAQKRIAEILTNGSEGMRRWNSLFKSVAIASNQGARTPMPEMLEEVDEMIRPDGYYRLTKGFLPAGSDKWERSLAIVPASEAENKIAPLSHSFDPFWYMTDLNMPAARYLNDIHRMWPAFATVSGSRKVKRDGDIVEYEATTRGIVNRSHFDLARGGNVIEVVNRSDSSSSRSTVDYKKIGDVWIPCAYTLDSFMSNDRSFHRRMKFVINELNIPIDEKEFTVEKMGILPGTRVSDNIARLFYLYGQEGNAKVITDRR